MSLATPPRRPSVPERRPPAPPAGGYPPRPPTPRPGRFDALLGPARLLVRFGGMVSKEIAEIWRQPVLMLTLILGPFLVLLLFGIGSTGQQPPVQTILVVPNDGTFSTEQGAYKDALSTGVNLLRVTTSHDDALAALRRGEADVVVTLPDDVKETITSGRQATVEIRYNAIDPLKVNYIRYLAYVQIAELNRLTLQAAAKQGQGQVSDLQHFTSEAKQALDTADAQIQVGNTRQASDAAAGLDQRAGPVQGDLLTAARLLAGLAALAAQPGQPPVDVPSPPGQAAVGMSALRQHLAAFQQDLSLGSSARDQQHADIQRMRQDVADLDQLTSTIKQIPPEVVAAPFISDTKDDSPLPASYVLFYGPAVLALLLQHVGVTFGSLSLVRERLLGATELFSVAPIRTVEILVGKYAAYTLISLVVAFALMGLMHFGLGVPIFGLGFQAEAARPVLWGSLSPSQLQVAGYDVAVVLVMIVASLGIGFFISAISTSEHQAVQLSMLVLLASVFFGGLFIPLASIIMPIRLVGYALPVTYGINALQTLMLRGLTEIRDPLIALIAMSAVLFVVTTLLAGRQLKNG